MLAAPLGLPDRLFAAGEDLKYALAVNGPCDGEPDPVAVRQKVSFAAPLLFAASSGEDESPQLAKRADAKRR